MNIDPAPRLNKLVFLAIDAGLLITAVLIVLFAKDPYAPLPFVTAVGCVLIAAIIGIAPLVIELIAESRDYVQEERRRIVDLEQRLQAASESLTRAASQIKAIEEAVHKSARDAETLPYRMAEKLAEFNEALAEKESADREALELELEELRSANSGNLKSVADKIHKATTDWTALENSTRKQLTLAQEMATKIDALLKNSLAQIELRALAAAPQSYTPPHTVGEESAPPVAPEATPPAAAAPASAPEAAAPAALEPAVNGESPKPKKARPPRKPKPEDTLMAMSETPVVAEPVEPVVSSPSASDDSEMSSENSNRAESSSSSDGATRLLTTAYIGIGNKLFIRGDGPGLSWDRGVPMQFVSIGKWGWSTQDAAGPVRVKLLKNDETPALTGDLTLEPGRHTEITALF